MNCFLHGMDGAQIEWGDTINNPKLLHNEQLRKFDIVVANPPFSLDKWGAEDASTDAFKRFHRGVPPKSKGDYAFISHMIETTVEATGKVGVIVPHGVLFRASSEGKIRKNLIEENLLEAVIGLPANIFFGTGIPTCILVLKKTRGANTNNVLFIDASGKENYEKVGNQNQLRPIDIQRITDTYTQRETIDKFSYVAKLSEIAENDYNLNIPRYVDTFEEEEPIDIAAVADDLVALEKQMQATNETIAGFCKELGIKTPF